MMAADDPLAIAIRHHEAGRRQAAEQIYRQILAREPDRADALHLLASIAHQTGRLDEAVAGWSKVARLKPDFAAAHYNLGLAFKDQGKLEEAAACWRRALELQPCETSTHNNLGNVLRELGRLDEAVTCYRRALQVQPDVPRLHYNLGNALRDQEKLDEAVAAYRRAVELAPDYAEAHSNLGNVLRRQGDLDGAIACWRRTVELKPDFAEAHFNLSIAYTDREEFPEAIAACCRALALKPDFAEAHNNLGNALREVGELDRAVASCQRAIALRPDLADAHNNLGNAFKDRGDLEAAIACYRRAIELRPDFAKGHYNLGSAWEHGGDFQKAEEEFRRALALDPRYALAHFNLAKLLRGKLPDGILATQRSMAAEPDLPDARRMLLDFGLAHALDARGDYFAAAEHLARANALQLAQWRRRGREYDVPQQARLVARMIDLCTPEFLARLTGCGAQSEAPVFVTGLPRSGTTLVEQILAAHSQVFAAGEIKLVPQTLAVLAGPGGDLIEGLRKLDRPTADRLAARHVDKLRALGGAALRVADKLPENYVYLGLLAVLFPRAKFILCRRDPRDVALSCWMTHFQEIRWANDCQHIITHFHEYQRIVAHWRQVLPVPLLEVDYEETVNDLEGAARRLVEFCGLDWQPRCLDFHQTTRPITTASATQVRQPIYKTSIGRWKHYAQPLALLFAGLECEK